VAKVTSKLQVTIPRAIADQFGIRPGDEIAWKAAGDAIRIEPAATGRTISVEERLRLFDEATARVRRRKWKGAPARERGWKREDLYDRGRAR
jgi:AbrB family looped-hinge helix DNA binding protein